MKMIEKKDCEYRGGYIVHDGEVVGIDPAIVTRLNAVETELQRNRFCKAEGKVVPVEPAEFERKSEHGVTMPHVKAETPELDKMAEQALKIMDEIDDDNRAAEINGYFARLKDVFAFIDDDCIVSTATDALPRFDLPTLGNPLELTVDKVAKAIVESLG